MLLESKRHYLHSNIQTDEHRQYVNIFVTLIDNKNVHLIISAKFLSQNNDFSPGELCQARTSYLPKEILWGHRFERIEEYDIGHSRWHVDFSGETLALQIYLTTDPPENCHLNVKKSPKTWPFSIF